RAADRGRQRSAAELVQSAARHAAFGGCKGSDEASAVRDDGRDRGGKRRARVRRVVALNRRHFYPAPPSGPAWAASFSIMVSASSSSSSDGCWGADANACFSSISLAPKRWYC